MIRMFMLVFCVFHVGSPQSSKPLLSLAASAPAAGKYLLKPALVLPQTSPSSALTSSTTNASRTASFAAALRNLAHHAKEPSGN